LAADVLLILGAALLLAAAGTPVMRRVAIRIGIVDHTAERKLHTRSMPLLGGVALYAAVLGALMLYPEQRALVQLAGILVGATWVSFCGLWDDSRGMRPLLKLLAQGIAGLILLMSSIQVALPVPGWVNVALTLLWIIGITNAINLLDNMDGLAGGVGAVAAGVFLLLAAMNGQVLVGALAAALLGACLGFLLHNFNPARIFMGDSGSLFLGFLLAAVGIKLRFPDNVDWITWMVPILVLGVPVFDTTLVVVSRLRRGRNPFTTPGKDHVSHRLVQLGWTRREAVLLLYLAGSALGGVGVFVSQASALGAYLAALLVTLVALAALVWLECRAPLGENSS
jgi:UDP-GlcNAc:undecaprenyl-phosphate GlcNAc-1-phosphate transferase